MENLKIKEGVTLNDLKLVAQARLLDFHALKKAQQYAGAVYMGRFVIEIYLKCLICKRLQKHGLPELFHSHDLNGLLYYSGWNEELERDAQRWDNFTKITAFKIDMLRYQNPDVVTESDCNDWDIWLNDVEGGLVPWLQSKLQ